MSRPSRTVKFKSDSAFAHFKDAAEWRHAANYMEVKSSTLEITFFGTIDQVLVEQGRDMGGDWSNG